MFEQERKALACEKKEFEHRIGELETEQCLIKGKLALILQTMSSSDHHQHRNSTSKRIVSLSIEQIIKEIH